MKAVPCASTSPLALSDPTTLLTCSCRVGRAALQHLGYTPCSCLRDQQRAAAANNLWFYLVINLLQSWLSRAARVGCVSPLRVPLPLSRQQHVDTKPQDPSNIQVSDRGVKSLCPCMSIREAWALRLMTKVRHLSSHPRPLRCGLASPDKRQVKRDE